MGAYVVVVLATSGELLFRVALVFLFIGGLFIASFMAILAGKRKKSTMSEGSAYGDDSTRNSEWLKNVRQQTPNKTASPPGSATAGKPRPTPPATKPTAPPTQPKPAPPSAKPASLPTRPLPTRPVAPTPAPDPAPQSFAEQLKQQGNPNGGVDPMRQFDGWESQA